MEPCELDKLRKYINGLETHSRNVAEHYREVRMSGRTPRRQDYELDITTCDKVVRDLREMFPELNH